MVLMLIKGTHNRMTYGSCERGTTGKSSLSPGWTPARPGKLYVKVTMVCSDNQKAALA